MKDAPGGELPPTVPAVPPVTIAGTASVPALTPATVDVRGEPGSPANPSVQKLAFKPASKSEAVKEKIEITLLGVVESDRPVAMLRVGGSERTARVGDEIVPGLRIESVTLSGLTFVKRPGVLLAPGDQILL